jgi:hypothetical protein
MSTIQIAPVYDINTLNFLFRTVSCPCSFILASRGQGEVRGDEIQITNDLSFQAELGAALAAIRQVAKAKLDLAQRFNALASKWKKERGVSSSLTKIVLCPSYQKIIAMGPDTVPLILGRLKEEGEEPDLWFWALESLTGENPVPEDDVGDFRAMAEAWLNWGGRHAKLGTR